MSLRPKAIPLAITNMLVEIRRLGGTPTAVFSAAAEVLVAAGFAGIRYYQLAQETVPGVSDETICYLSWERAVGEAKLDVGYAIPWKETSLALHPQASRGALSPVVHCADWFIEHDVPIPAWVYDLGLDDSAWIDIPICDHGVPVGLLAADWPGPVTDVTAEVDQLLSALASIIGSELSATSQPVVDELRTRLLNEHGSYESADGLVLAATAMLREALDVVSASVFKYSWVDQRLTRIDPLILSPTFKAVSDPPAESYLVGECLTGCAWLDPAYREVLNFEIVRDQLPALAAPGSVRFHEEQLHMGVRCIIYAALGTSDCRYLVRLINRESNPDLPFLQERDVVQRWAEDVSPFVDSMIAAARAKAVQDIVPLMAEPISLIGIARTITRALSAEEGINDVKIVAHRIGNAQPHFFHGFTLQQEANLRTRILQDEPYTTLIDQDRELVVRDGQALVKLFPVGVPYLFANLLSDATKGLLIFPFASGGTRGVMTATMSLANGRRNHVEHAGGWEQPTSNSNIFLKHLASMMGQAVESQYVQAQSQGALRALSLVGHELVTPVAALGSMAQLALVIAKQETGEARSDDPAATPPSYFDDLRNRIQFNLDLVDAAVRVGKVVGQQVDGRFVGVRREESLIRLLNRAIYQVSNEIRDGLLLSPNGLLMAQPTGDKFLQFCCDRGLFVIALANLYRNAVKYSLPHEARPRVFTSVQQITANKGRRYIDIVVTNDGLGIPPNYGELIFQPFVRYTENEPDLAIRGMGLGLFLVRQIARSHGGDVTLRENRATGRYRRPGKEAVPVHRTAFAMRVSAELAAGDYEYRLANAAWRSTRETAGDLR